MLIVVNEYSSTYRPTFRGTVGGLDSVSLEEVSSVQTSVHDSPGHTAPRPVVRWHGDQKWMRIIFFSGAQPWTHKDKADNVSVMMLEDGSTFKFR